MMNRQGWADVAETKLYYEITGRGEPLVLIHGFSLDTRMWDSQVAAFAKHFQVLRYDLRGYGRSPLPTDQPYHHTTDLHALLAYLDIRSAHLLGLSMGGGVALNFTLTYPAMVQSLVLVDSVLAGHPWSDEGRTLAKALDQTAKRDLPAAKALWRQHPFFVPAQENAAVTAQLHQIIDSYSGWHWQYQDPLTRSSPPDIQRLREISVPTLAMVGERDMADFHAILATFQQQIARAQTVVLPGVGHMSNLEAPAQFNQVVLDFLTNNKSQATNLTNFTNQFREDS